MHPARATYARGVKRKAWWLVGTFVFAACLVRHSGGCFERPLRVGTYNIEQFGNKGKKTDIDRLVTIIGEADPDVLAVQEIQNERSLRDLAKRLSRGQRSYRVALSDCGGRSEMKVGVLYDENRTKVKATNEYPELDPNKKGQCSAGERPGLGVNFDDGEKKPFWLLVVHLIARGDREMFEKRKEQWKKAHAIAKTLGASGTPVAILGDTNSTGWLDDKFDERTFIEDEAKAAGKVVATRGLACSEYWQPDPSKLEVSLLDHVVAPPGLVNERSVEVHSFCKELRCKSTSEKPIDFENVSDHCPVTFDVSR